MHLHLWEFDAFQSLGAEHQGEAALQDIIAAVVTTHTITDAQIADLAVALQSLQKKRIASQVLLSTFRRHVSDQTVTLDVETFDFFYDVFQAIILEYLCNDDLVSAKVMSFIAERMLRSVPLSLFLVLSGPVNLSCCLISLHLFPFTQMHRRVQSGVTA